MRIICQKGYYKFFPQDILEVARFGKKFGTDLVYCRDYFTFPALASLPNYSIKGQIYSGQILALATHAGNPEEVMEKNGLAYSLTSKRLLLRSSFAGFIKADYFFGNYIFSNSLIQAYNYDNVGGLITGFNGFVDVNFMKFKIEKLFYENL